MKLAKHPMRAAIVAACLGLGPGVAAAAVTVGSVDKVQEQATATQAGATRDLAPAGPVFFRDRMRTGVGARLEAKLDDGTVLTLGEKGRLTVDEFVYRPGEQGNRLALSATRAPSCSLAAKSRGRRAAMSRSERRSAYWAFAARRYGAGRSTAASASSC